MRRLLASVLTLALALAVPAVGLRADDQGPFHIPVLLSLTGNGAFVGKLDLVSIQLIEKMVNDHGGVNHRQIKFDVTDEGSSPQTTVQLTNQILAAQPAIMIGPGLTQDCVAAGPLVKSGPVQYCVSPGISPPAGGWIFSTSVSLRDDAVALIRYFRERGLTRLAIISSTDATGEEIDRDYDYARSLPENRDVTFVVREHFNLSDVSVAAQMARIKGAHPQALLTWTVGPAMGTEFHAMQEVGLDVPVLASTAVMISGQLDSYKAFIPKDVLFTGVLSSAPSVVGNGPVKNAIDAYLQAFKEAGTRAEFPNTLSWDPVLIVLDAYRHLGFNATKDQMRAYINGLHGWAGINGIYDFRDGTQHGVGQNAIIMCRWNPETSTFNPVSKRGGYLK